MVSPLAKQRKVLTAAGTRPCSGLEAPEEEAWVSHVVVPRSTGPEVRGAGGERLDEERI